MAFKKAGSSSSHGRAGPLVLAIMDLMELWRLHLLHLLGDPPDLVALHRHAQVLCVDDLLDAFVADADRRAIAVDDQVVLMVATFVAEDVAAVSAVVPADEHVKDEPARRAFSRRVVGLPNGHSLREHRPPR